MGEAITNGGPKISNQAAEAEQARIDAEQAAKAAQLKNPDGTALLQITGDEEDGPGLPANFGANRSKANETVPGGRFWVQGRLVDANGKVLGVPSPAASKKK